MTVPKAGNMLLETEAKFLISPLERLLKSKGNGVDIVSLPELREGRDRRGRGKRGRIYKSWLALVYMQLKSMISLE